MRPIYLELEGFGAFREPTAVDFADTDFFALVGATGSGKSTLVDAICFALYGNVPRYDDERMVGPAMSAGHVETAVRLTFDVGGARCVAARVVRRDRQGKVSTKEARLERDGVELAGRASEMGAEVERLLGLPYAHFTRCVVLPQGEFARFLHDRPADRQALLVQLLDLGVYERMATHANRRASAASAAADAAAGRIAELAHATDDQRAEAEQRLAALQALADRLEKAEAEIGELDAAAAAAEQSAAAGRAIVAALGEVQVPPAARTAAAELAAAHAAVVEAEEARRLAQDEAEAARVALAALPGREQLLSARRAWTDHAAAVVAHGDALRLATEASDAVAAAEAVLARATELQAEADAEHEVARQAFAAHVLAEQVQVGSPCPVCGQAVREPVQLEPPQDLAVRKDAAVRAREATDADRGALELARRREAAASASLEARARRVAELADLVAGGPTEEALAGRLTEVEAATEREAASRAAERSASAALDSARGCFDRTRQQADALRPAYFDQRAAVAAASPPPPVDDVVEAWDELARWSTEVLPAHRESTRQAEAEHARALAERQAALDDLVQRAADAGVSAKPDLTSLRVAAGRAEAEGTQAVTAIVRDLAARADAEREQAANREVAAVAQELGKLLSARRFERWMVAEALERLAAGASTTLRSLTGGQYSLQIGTDGEFSVIDHANGDEVRPVRTLSGGETFQASLALALALADELSGLAVGSAPKLEAIFLDEGFGTLDPDSLETVAATIEALGATGRMVGIVTHVRDLAARVPVRYEVRKGARSAVVERVVG